MNAPIKPIKWTGEKITKPGLYSHVPMDFYHGDCCAGPSISSTGLRQIIKKSPRDYWVRSYMNPARKPFEESEALTIGRALHHLILGEADFHKQFAIKPETYPGEDGLKKKWTRAAKYCKEWEDKQRKAGRDILSAANVESIIGMAKALAEDPLVQNGALNGLVECSMFWQDKKTGIWLKSRPDTVPTHSGDAVDLKTISDIDYQTCERSLETNGYYQQAALVRQGFKEVLNIEVTSFIYLFVEKPEPNSARPMIVKDATLDKGDEANRVGLDVMAHCLKKKDWPRPGRGPNKDVVAEYIELNEWALKRVDFEISRAKENFGV